MSFSTIRYVTRTLIFVAIFTSVCCKGKSLSRNKRYALQDFHNKVKSHEEHEKRIAVIRAKVAEVNSNKFDEPVVMVNLRKQMRRHHELVRDGNGGYRRVTQPSFQGTEVKLNEEASTIDPRNQNKVLKQSRKDLIKTCLKLNEILKESNITLIFKCELNLNIQ